MKFFKSIMYRLGLGVRKNGAAIVFTGLLSWHAQAASVFFEVPLKSNDVAYSSYNSNIYVTVPSVAGQPYGNRLVEISRTSGTITRSVFVGSEPNVIAISSDGLFAYVGLDGAASVRRIDLQSMNAGLQFSLGRPELSETFFVDDMKVLPDLPDSIVVSRRNDTTIPWHEGVAVYDSGVQRPGSTPSQQGSNSIALLNPSTVVGYDNTSTDFGLWRMTIDSNGIAVQEHVSNVLHGYGHRVVTNGNAIFSTSGEVADGLAFQLLGSYGVAGPVVPEALPGAVAIVANTGASISLFDQNLFSLTRTISLPSSNGTPLRASPCGTSCVVFNTSSDRIVIVLIDYDSIFSGSFD